jgi:hypothetical protein
MECLSYVSRGIDEPCEKRRSIRAISELLSKLADLMDLEDLTPHIHGAPILHDLSAECDLQAMDHHVWRKIERLVLLAIG